MKNARALLISNSICYGQGFLDHVIDQIANFLRGETSHVLFIPYARDDWDVYTAEVRTRLQEIDVNVVGIHEQPNAIRAIERFKAIFVGGGNTFQLFHAIKSAQLFGSLLTHVTKGGLYIGSSAGTNLACPTLATTNDMPIVWPSNPLGLHIVRFQINPHYIDVEPGSTHMGETRELRIKQFQAKSPLPVVGLREGSFLKVNGNDVWLEGPKSARIFLKGREPFEQSTHCLLSSHIRNYQSMIAVSDTRERMYEQLVSAV